MALVRAFGEWAHPPPPALQDLTPNCTNRALKWLEGIGAPALRVPPAIDSVHHHQLSCRGKRTIAAQWEKRGHCGQGAACRWAGTDSREHFPQVLRKDRIHLIGKTRAYPLKCDRRLNSSA